VQRAGSDKTFELEVAKGAGSYVCGEETALRNRWKEARRSPPRSRRCLRSWVCSATPPVINTYHAGHRAIIFARRGFIATRPGRSRGTLPFQIAGNVNARRLVELAFG